MGTKKTDNAQEKDTKTRVQSSNNATLSKILLLATGVTIGVGAHYFFKTQITKELALESIQEQRFARMQTDFSDVKKQLKALDLLKEKGKEKSLIINDMGTKIASLEQQLQATSNKIHAVEAGAKRSTIITARKAYNIISQLSKTERRLQRLDKLIKKQTDGFKKAKIMWGAVSEIRTSFIKGQAFGEHFDILLGLSEKDPEMKELIRTLAPFKDKEPPTLIELIEAFKKVESRLIQSSIASQKTLASRLKNQLSSMIIIRKKDQVSDVSENNSAIDIINAVQTSLRKGNVEQALLHFEKLGDNTRSLAAEWAERARTFLDVQGTIQQIDSDVITSFSLSQTGDQ